MKILYRSQPKAPPELSIVLVDWSCRESFHILDHLSRQNCPRESFEVIWVEYFDRQPEEIARRVASADGEPSPVDIWTTLEMPAACYYHKHLMYNVGIALARGRIVCIADSDAIVGPDFVSSILERFAANPKIVLHLDEVRNISPKHYPFNDPAMETITGPGCINWINRRPAGLWDEIDPLHSRNYGACMAAMRRDLIEIGGADEQMDYLGHICGPYEMTFRLVSLGRTEQWHDSQWLYHVWHPGQAGENDLLGPHDGRHMSSAALAARASRRVLPVKENPAIRAMRTTGRKNFTEAELARLLIDTTRQRQWQGQAVRSRRTVVRREDAPPPSAQLSRRIKLQLAMLALRQIRGELAAKVAISRRMAAPVGAGGKGKLPRRTLRKAVNLLRFLRRCGRYERYVLRQGWMTVKALKGRGDNAVGIYGLGYEARMLEIFAQAAGVEVAAVVAWEGFTNDRRTKAQPVAAEVLAGGAWPVLVAGMVNVDEKVRQLVDLGVVRERIWVLR